MAAEGDGARRARARVVDMPHQFTLMRLMVSVTLFAVSLAMIRQICCNPSNWMTRLQAFIASGCIGGAVAW